MKSSGAHILRETTGTSGLERSLRDAIAILAHHLEPHLVAGGLAVQEHGHHRVTLDADIIVLDPAHAVELLTTNLSGPFERYLHCEDKVRDRRNGVLIDLLPGGRAYKSTCKVPFPIPSDVSDQPVFVGLEKLISLKLDSWFSSPNRRLKDKSDVMELIKALRLPRALAVDEQIRQLYLEAWDGLEQEPE